MYGSLMERRNNQFTDTDTPESYPSIAAVISQGADAVLRSAFQRRRICVAMSTIPNSIVAIDQHFLPLQTLGHNRVQ